MHQPEEHTMRKIGITLTLILTTWITSTGQCHANALGIQAGYIDTQDLGNSIGVGGKLQIDLPGNLNLEARTMMYDSLGQDLRVGGNNVETDLEIWPIELGIEMDIPLGGRFYPYFGGGIGWYLLEADLKINGRTEILDLDDEFGFYLVGGLNFELANNIAVYGEYVYRQVEGSLKNDNTSRLVDDAVTVDLGGHSINVGLLLKW
jgi:opacity protein-like surface antigen